VDISLASNDLDQSALINLRLRRLLNAYGDVWKFQADMERVPVWNRNNLPSKTGFATDPGPSWGKPFTFTSSGDGIRFFDLPGTDGAGKPLGLGDAIILQRPATGYRDISKTESIVNEWGVDNLIGVDNSFLNEQTFFEKIRDDLTVTARVDDTFYRMAREFTAGYSSDFRKPQDNTAALTDLYPNYNNLWQKHPVSLINLNRASFPVRSAVFYALVNVGYLQERRETISFLLETLTSSNSTKNNISPFVSTRPTIGVAGPCLEDFDENGYAFDDDDPDAVKFAQPFRLMSLRDAMVLSQAYGEAPELGLIRPKSFSEFENFLHQLVNDSAADWSIAPLERVPSAPTSRGPDGIDYSSVFAQDYLALTLPSALSGTRRLPGWLNAPWALLNPLLQNTKGLWSAEDFVQKAHLPKITFSPGSLYRIYSRADITLSQEVKLTNTIEAEFGLPQTTKKLSSQQDFADAIVAATSIESLRSDPDIVLGPEPAGVDPHAVLATVGLRDEMEDPKYDAGQRPHSVAVAFDADLYTENMQSTSLPPRNYSPVDPITDVFNYAQGDIGIAEKWPPGYEDIHLSSAVHYFPNFEQNCWDAITGPPISDRTWQYPNDGNTLNLLRTQPFLRRLYEDFRRENSRPWPPNNPPPWSLAQWRDFLEEAWPFIQTYYFFPQGIYRGFVARKNPGPGATLENYLWNLIPVMGARLRRNVGGAPVTQYSFKWTDWAPNWKNGQPKPGVEDHLYLRGAGLEGPDKSLFSTGAGGCDLSPFGGVSLTSRGHAHDMSPRFSDSLYWRPYSMLGIDITDPSVTPGSETAATLPGAVFNKGVISLWVRIPSGFRSPERRSLFYLNVHETVDDLLGTSLQSLTARPKKEVTRPFYLSATIATDRNAANGSIGLPQIRAGNGMPDQIKTGEGTTIDVLPWSEDVLHPGKVAFDPAIRCRRPVQ